MGWLDNLFGKQDNYSKTLRSIQEREVRKFKERQNADLPVVGKMATAEDRLIKEMGAKEEENAREVEIFEQKEEEKEKASQDLLLVLEGARLKCELCTSPQGILKVNLDTSSTQNKRTATIVERDAKSLVFTGNCTKSPNSASPCAAVMQLGEWKDTGILKVQNQPPLLKKSTIPCLYGGTEIEITDSGQVNEPEEPALNTLDKGLEIVHIKGIKKSKEGEREEIPVSVCQEIECVASYTGENKFNEIRWRVKVGDEDFREVKDLEAQLKKELVYPYTLVGEIIYFPVPKEWGQKDISFEVYTNNPKIEIKKSEEIKVKDHIIAAFCRINTKEAEYLPIHVAEESKGTWDVFAFLGAYVHHHQGMYKDGDIFYVSGSTGLSPAYVYVIGKDSSQPLLFNRGALNFYKHPGGLQVAQKLLAVGMEEYAPTGAFVKKKSMVCFFDTLAGDINSSELTHLRIIRDESYIRKVDTSPYVEDDVYNTNSYYNEYRNTDLEYAKNIEIKNDMASAIGIVYYKGEWIVAVRGDKQAVDFYIIDQAKKSVKLLKDGLTKVGEFQNLNLFLDENEDIYMFGMGSSSNICNFYRVEIDTETYTVDIKAVWIKNGVIREEEYTKTDKNNITFTCKDPVSFHWASCIELDENKSQTKETGFLGKFSLYSVGPKVINNTEIPCNLFTE